MVPVDESDEALKAIPWTDPIAHGREQRFSSHEVWAGKSSCPTRPAELTTTFLN